MTYYWDRTPGTRPLGQPRRPAGVTTVLAADNARRTLETGVTTVRDLGASNEVDYAMRDLINMGRMVGPRMFVAGQGLSAARGGAAEARDVPPAGRGAHRRRIGLDQDLRLARQLPERRHDADASPFEEMKAAVDAAHAKNHRVAIHSYGPSGVKDAVRAGADSVEHGIDLDDETIAEMAKRGTVWVPTIDHNRYYVDAKDEFGFAPDTIPPLQAYIEKNLESTRRAFKAGVKLGDGLGRRLHDVRPEHARARLVRQGRHDAGAGARRGDDDSGGAARPWRRRSARSRPATLPTSSRSRAIRSRTSTCSSTRSAG